MPRRIEHKPIVLRKRLDAAGVRAHLESVARSAQFIEIRTRSRVATNSQAAAARLDEVASLLLSGEIQALQLRFDQDDQTWCDTLMRVADSYRLVRMPMETPDEMTDKDGDRCPLPPSA